MSKKIILTESQEHLLVEHLICEKRYPVETDKVLHVKNFLDKNFERGKISKIGENGFPLDEPIVGVKYNNKVVQNKTGNQLLDILKDEYRGLYEDKIRLEKFLARVMIDWYYKRITKEGLLSVTHC